MHTISEDRAPFLNQILPFAELGLRKLGILFFQLDFCSAAALGDAPILVLIVGCGGVRTWSEMGRGGIGGTTNSVDA